MKLSGQTLCITPKLLVALESPVTMSVREIKNSADIRIDVSDSFPAEAALIFGGHICW
jgi:hypothetical protein